MDLYLSIYCFDLLRSSVLESQMIDSVGTNYWLCICKM